MVRRIAGRAGFMDNRDREEFVRGLANPRRVASPPMISGNGPVEHVRKFYLSSNLLLRPKEGAPVALQ